MQLQGGQPEGAVQRSGGDVDELEPGVGDGGELPEDPAAPDVEQVLTHRVPDGPDHPADQPQAGDGPDRGEHAEQTRIHVPAAWSAAAKRAAATAQPTTTGTPTPSSASRRTVARRGDTWVQAPTSPGGANGSTGPRSSSWLISRHGIDAVTIGGAAVGTLGADSIPGANGSEVPMIHTCPRCESLRESELRSHLERDHDMSAEVFEPLHYTGRGGGPRRGFNEVRYLVVGNRTLGSKQLESLIRERAAARPAGFFMLAPADSRGSEPPDQAKRLAGERLRHLVDLLHADGIDAEGMVGDPDPFKAIEDVLEQAERFDEIVLSTLPPALSRWLASDLASRLERNFHLPVTRVEAAV